MPQLAPLRLPRAVLVTSLVVGLAAAAHTAGGGHLPPFPVVVLLAVLLLLPITVLARRRLSFPSLAGILGSGQVVLHTGFTGLSGALEPCGASGIAAHSHHQAVSIPGCAWAPAADPMTQEYAAQEFTTQGFAVIGPIMFALHVLAVAATALLLAHGETLLWRMLAWLTPAIVAVRPAPLPESKAPAPGSFGFPPPRHPYLRTPSLRGPPPLQGSVAAFA